MPRSITVHPASLALGLVLAAVVFVSMSQVTVPTPVRVEYSPHPKDMIQIRQGTPFTVPAGKVLVLTALGTVGLGAPTGARVWFEVNGQPEGGTYANNQPTFPTSSITSIPVGRSVVPGSTVAAMTNCLNCSARVWGYLADVGTSQVGASTTLRVPYQPHPRDMIQIVEGSPYSVPSGQVFVLTAIGELLDPLYPSTPHALNVNGQTELTVGGQYPQLMPPLLEVPTGFTAQAGQVIEIVALATGSTSPGRAWGYLVAQ